MADAPNSTQQPPRQDQQGSEGNDAGAPPEGAQNGAEGRETATPNEATLRKRAQDAEAAAAKSAERVEKMQTREVEGMAAGLHDPADLWAHVKLSDLLTADGDLDDEKVALAVSALIDSKPYLAKGTEPTKAGPRPGFGQGTGYASAPPELVGWGAVFGRG